MFVKSNQINMVDGPSGKVFVFHSLYNNPRILDSSVADFLNYFSIPRSIDDVKENFDGDFNEIIRELTGLGFLVQTGNDGKEYLKLSQQTFLAEISTGKKLSRLELAISNACNLACPHCMHFKNNELPNEFNKLNMSTDTAKKCIDVFVSKIRKQGNSKVRIHFGNGEPLLNWKTIEFVLEYCSSIDDIDFSYAINTNLTLLNKKIADQLKRYHVKISTSLDGMKTGNDLMRVDKRGRGTFDMIISKFELLRDINYPLDGFSITVTDRNFAHVDERIIDLAKKFGIKEISLDYDLVSSIETPIDKCVEKILRLRKYARKHGILLYGNWETPFRTLMSSSWLNAPYAYCPAMEGTTLEFNVDGSIRVCGHTHTVVGADFDIDATLKNGGKYLNLIYSRLPGNNKRCNGCMIEGACAGQCHVTVESSERDRKLMDNLCKFSLLTTVGLIREYLELN